MTKSITRSAICVLMVLLAANVFGTVSSQGQSVLSSEDNIINILGIDPTAYPKIKVNIFVDESCAATGGIVKDDFTVEEDGTGVSIDSLYFTGRASGQKLDLAVVFDETDTMADEIKAMKSNVDDLTNKIKASNIDARYSLVTFKTEVLTKIEWTDDPEVFKREVNQLRAYGGFYQRPEDSLGAVAKALSFGFRPDAQKIVIVITDEPSMQRGDGWSNSTYHQDDVQQELLDAGVMLVAVSPDFRSRSIPSNIPRSDLPLYADMRELAQNSGGLWIDIYSADLSVILDQLEEIITGTYVIEYTSPATTTIGSRTVSVSVNAPDCVEGEVSSTYMPPASPTVPNRPPIIFSLDSDKASPQESGSIITWTVETGDPDGDQELYRFFLNDEPMTDWTTEKTWTWEAKDSGSYRIEAHVRDGKHAGPNGLDDRRSANFEISRPNSPPTITTFMADKTGPQEAGSVITWTVEAEDPDGDMVLYRFLLDDEPMTDWRAENIWIWKASETGTYRIEAQVRDGKHAGPNGMDDRKSANFEIFEPNEPPMGEISHVEFNKTFGGPGDEGAFQVQPTLDGGYIIAGDTTLLGEEAGDAWVIKTDAEGKEIWNKTFGGREDDGAYSIQPTSDGGYILMVGSISFGAGGEDIWLIKTDSAGNIVWEKTLGGANNDVGQFIQETNDGGYIITGWTTSFGSGDFDAWLIKTDSGGREVWSRTFGGANADAAHSVRQTSDGGYILAGRTYNYGKGNVFNSDAWLIKTDAEGKEIWNKTFGGKASDFAYSVQPAIDGGYILSGSTRSYGGGGSDAWLIKTDSGGIEVWNRTFGGADEEMGFTVRSTSDGGYIIAASISEIESTIPINQIHQSSEYVLHGGQDVLLIKTDSEGRAVWSRIFGGANRDHLPSVEPAIDGGYILAGETSSFGAGGLDAWLIKVDSEGNIVRLPSPAG